ncbi:MAG: type II toxin-antitoxin system HicA family toxin [Isosphaeraceae bacterium]
MKRVDLIKAIESFGCHLVRHGGKHGWYRNPTAGVSQPVPRHVTARSRKVWPTGSFGCLAIRMMSLPIQTPELVCSRLDRQDQPTLE